MPPVQKPSNAPGVSLTYITLGGMLATLAGVSYIFYGWGTPAKFVDYIRLVTLIGGAGMILLGFAVGFIGQTARRAEVPPPSTQPADPQAKPAASTVPVAGSQGNGTTAAAAGSLPPSNAH